MKRMNGLLIIVVIILSLWLITNTIQKVTNKVLEKQDQQTQLLEEIKANTQSGSNGSGDK
ncbi:hypothetical protein CEH05_16050 [Halobacillus halophilus]|uniref:Uncharacterized protein n=2 Tax=Halobacillus halophilus TaxID=1570 RepID=I0JR14_HALH3|nr:hypothetical protein CEH05_16050 [Halobacillus halophilus]CCG46584.1 hypothetical protein HBHAL_4242 [Halobacillus halophilus DSM 2266]